MILAICTGNMYTALVLIAFTFGFEFPLLIFVIYKDSHKNTQKRSRKHLNQIKMFWKPPKFEDFNHIQSPDILGWCSVCHLPVYPYDAVIYCPFCGAAAHKTHFLEWVKIKGFCPKCNALLHIFDLTNNYLHQFGT